MTTDYRRPLDIAALAGNFRVFAEADCAGEPLYEALSRAIAADPFVLELLLQAPYAQRRPVLLFAATHDLLLAGTAHPLADFYRSVAPADRLRLDVGNAGPAFSDFCREHREGLATMLGSRATQTNEVGRSAGLRLMLSSLPPTKSVALIDVGCSAGLNLLVDRYRFDYRMPDGTRRIAGPDSSVVIGTDIVGGDPFPSSSDTIPTIARRIGIDLSPLDIRDERDARWLRACIWPSDAGRHERLAAAIAIARHEALDLRHGDASERVLEVLASLDDEVRPVVVHSWVVSYFTQPGKQAFVDAVRRMVVERDGAWISAEGPGVVPGLVPPPLSEDADATMREATVWHLTTREGDAAVSRAALRTHPHGRWIRALP